MGFALSIQDVIFDQKKEVYDYEFHPLGNEEYWPPYSGPILCPNPAMRRSTTGRPTTSRILNEMDVPSPNKIKKCGYCRLEGHIRSQCPYKEFDV